MRKINYKQIHLRFLSFFLLLLIFNFELTSITSAQDTPALIIEIYDSNNWNESTNNVMFEGRTYDIIVSSENETAIIGVNISLLHDTYTTTINERFITIPAPDFNDSESFIITATKQGYKPDELEITIFKGKLLVTTDPDVIEEKKEFQVTVKDQNNKPIPGAFIYVGSEVNSMMTDQYGRVFINAPEVRIGTTTTIQAIKSGYLPGSANIRIEHTTGFTFNLNESQFLQSLPILIAIIVVIFSIIYVLWRQKKTSTINHQIMHNESIEKPHSYQKEKQQIKNKSTTLSKKEKRDLSISPSLSRVEEIRIPLNTQKKETTILSNKKELEQRLNNQKTKQTEWFKGQEYMRYKLDELTGKIDQHTDGKWFEGETDTKKIIDETLQKKARKKSNEKDV